MPQNEPVALQPHLAPPTPPNHLYICQHMHLSVNMSVCHQATSLSIKLSISHMTYPSVPPRICSVFSPSVCHCLTICMPFYPVCQTI